MKKAACLIIHDSYSDHIRTVNRPNSIIPSLPGGKQEGGETPLECAIRECYEETGVVIDPDNCIEVITLPCYGDVDYEVTCFYTKSEDDSMTSGCEPGLTSSMMSITKFMEKCAFVEYNRQAFKQANLI